jgi:hypothetical protein
MEDRKIADDKQSAIEIVQRKKDIVRSYQKVFSSEDGQVVLHDMMGVFHFYSTTATPDPHETSFNEGQRSVILSILGILKVDSEKYTKNIMKIKENNDVNYFNYAENVS